MAYKMPNTDFDPTLGKGLAKALFFSQAPLTPAAELKEYCRGLLPSLLQCWPFHHSCFTGSCWASPAAEMSSIVMHQKTTKRAQMASKDVGSAAQTEGGVTKREEKSSFNNF